MKRLVLCLVVAALPLAAACAPAPPGPSCAGTAVGNVIATAFAGTDVGHAEYIAWRESRCDPGARNSSGASGLFQLELPLHQDLLNAACPLYPAWQDPYCNATAARLLYNSSGFAPWGG